MEVAIQQYTFTAHAEKMLTERDINREWVMRVVLKPGRTETRNDGTTHYLGAVSERDGRILRVITISERGSFKIITAFFDHRERGEDENYRR